MSGEFARRVEAFPATLVNWDMHPGNILVNGAQSVVIDWEQARSGPAMIDLPNLVTWDSDDMRRYADEFARHGGRPFDAVAKRAEYDWARAIVQIKYLPYAEHAEGETEIEAQDLEVGWYHEGHLELAAVLSEALALALPSRTVCNDSTACDARTQALLDQAAEELGGPKGHPGFAALAGLVSN